MRCGTCARLRKPDGLAYEKPEGTVWCSKSTGNPRLYKLEEVPDRCALYAPIDEETEEKKWHREHSTS